MVTPFLNFDAYAEAVYSPPPQLVALAEDDPFWRTFGGDPADPFGDGGETHRQRLAASGHTGPGGYMREAGA